METTVARRAIVGVIAAGVALGAQIEFGGDPSGPTCKIVDLDNRQHARILDHAHDAIDRGLPERLTIKRDEAAGNRRLSLRGIPTRAGHDRDEYPPATADEGGKGASVRYVLSPENRSAGARLALELRGLPEGACFRYEARP
jgi:hypothetical protein